MGIGMGCHRGVVYYTCIFVDVLEVCCGGCADRARSQRELITDRGLNPERVVYRALLHRPGVLAH